jgi:ribosomal protein S18 acetylase RimI-like enzyme
MTDGEALMVTIRPMEEGDLPSVTALMMQLGYPSTLEAITCRYRAIVADDGCALYVGQVGGAVVGWVYVRGVLLLEDDARAEVWGLVVDEERRRQRIGEALMRRAEQWARDAGYREVRLRSNVTRTGAHAFYRRIGYSTTKTSHTLWKALVS